MKKGFHVFFVFMLIAVFAAIANAGQVSLQTGDDGQYINMPVTGTDTLVIPLAYTEGGSFKVYDDGLGEEYEGDYSNNADGALALTAPDGYAFHITGIVETESSWDTLNIYKGNPEDNILFIEGLQGYAEIDFFAAGPTLVLKFHSDGEDSYAGFDLDVQLVSSTSHTVTINNVDGGTVTSDIGGSLVAEWDIVKLIATPDAGYILSGIEVKDADDDPVEVIGGFWYSNNTATFIMPQKNVTVTPVFEEVNPPYINMPAYDEKIVSIPLGVTSFKVYDDGGKDGNNSSDAKGILILNAPEGYLFQISGTVDMADGAFLSFGEGDDAEDFELLQDVYSENTEIETITATKRSVGIYFNPNGDDAHSGLDLTITVFDPSAPHTVAINTADNGTVESDGSLVRAGETVTLTAAPNSNYILTGIEVRGVYDHQPVEVEGGFWYTGNSATFVMPQKDVEVTPVFGPASEAYINMPTTGTVMVDVPSGLTSFKVYDDGGIDENYSSEANGYLVLTAPAGYVFEISGTANTEEGYDYLNVYSGAIDNRVLLRTLSGSGASIGPVLSDVGSMVLNFYSDGSGEGQGFVLNVELVEATESHTITLNNITGGLVTSNTNSAQVGESVAIGVDLQNNYWLNKIKVVKDDGSSINVNYGTWYSMNSATFVMPYADVTVTPEYVTTPTAEGGLSVNIPTNYRSINVDIPRGVSSFKVHHDEIVGPGMGQIVLNAPEGTLIQVSGMDNSHQASLGIFEKDIYGDEWRIWGGEDGNTSPSLRSAGNKLRISLETGDPDMPLDLTVEIIDLSLAFNVNDADDIEHGSIDANTRSAAMGNVVTLTATPEEGYLLKEILVTDASGNPIEVAGGTWTSENTGTFEMPYSDVTVKPVFINTLTAEDGLYINMKNRTKLAVNIPRGVVSFKVYDNGGSESNGLLGKDSLELKAPDGYFLQVSGRMRNTSKIMVSTLVIYDGEAGSDSLFKERISGALNSNVADKISSGSLMTICMSTGLNSGYYSTSYTELDLTVTLVPTTQYAAITVSENEDGRKIAVIDGAYNGAGQIDIPSEIPVDTVVFNRTFSTSGFSTIMLPFNVTAGNIEGARSVIAFNGMVLNEATGDSAISMRYVWCNSDVVTAAAAEGDELTCNSNDAELSAYTPYMVEMTSNALTFKGSQTLKQTPASAETRVDGWVFRATLQKKVWKSTDAEIQGGRVWAFAAQERDGAKIGKYVRLGPGATTRPLRAYLVSDPQGRSMARGLFAKSSTASTGASVLPETIDVVIVNRDESGEEHTTVIGKFDTRTGEMRLDRNARTFDLNGRNVGGRVNAKGMYLKK